MSVFDHEDGSWEEPGGGEESGASEELGGGARPGSEWSDEAPNRRWPLHWHALYPRERRLWFEQLWSDVCMLRARYRLAVRSGWWEDQIQVEALAALASWVDRYDSGEWDDPPGKLSLLFELERVETLLREGRDPFYPRRDRPAFDLYLAEVGCESVEG